MGTILGAVIGIAWRKAIKFAEKRYRTAKRAGLIADV